MPSIKFLSRFTLFCILLLLFACTEEPSDSAEKPELLVYCGITMVKPMTEIARIIEKKHDVSVTLSQGGSEDLYESLKMSRKGDLYLPGSSSYRELHLQDGFLGEYVHIGFNQAALMVNKSNPKKITGLSDIFRNDINFVICSPDSGSIGRETQRILTDQGIYEKALEKSIYLTSDSRNLNGALRKGDADLIINWRATAFFPENKAYMDVIDLDTKMAKPKKLLLNLLTFSQYPDIARDFMNVASSPEGQAIFRKYGFLDSAGQSE